MKDLLDFQLSKKEYKESHCPDNYEGVEGIIGYLRYNNHFEIAVLKDSRYDLVLERSEYNTKDLEQLEILLWDWAKYELSVEPDDIVEDLHERARDLMEEIDEKRGRKVNLSLDEYYCEFMHENEEDDKKISYLLNQFDI